MNQHLSLSSAISYAATKHATQTRRDGTPFIYHPLKVAELVKDAGYDLKYQIVAVLHDTLEDTDATEDEIREFGEDILDAVKLLTRPENSDEEKYVEAILNNHLATVVKNADKIHNLWDASYCSDKKWAKQYIKKTEIYYKDKFSTALNHALLSANNTIRIQCAEEKPLFYTPDEMIPFANKEALAYQKLKQLYQECNSSFDFRNPSIQFWYDDFLKYYFCYCDCQHNWYLSRAGWLPLSKSPFEDSEYGEDFFPRTREQMENIIEQKKKENYFYDFVDLNTLL